MLKTALRKPYGMPSLALRKLLPQSTNLPEQEWRRGQGNSVSAAAAVVLLQAAGEKVGNVDDVLGALLAAEPAVHLGEAGGIARDDDFGIDVFDARDLVAEHRPTDFGHLDGEQAAEPAALIRAGSSVTVTPSTAEASACA